MTKSNSAIFINTFVLEAITLKVTKHICMFVTLGNFEILQTMFTFIIAKS